MKLTGINSHSQVSGKDLESSESPLSAGDGDSDANPAFGAIPPSADEAKKKIQENKTPIMIWEIGKKFRANQRTHSYKEKDRHGEEKSERPPGKYGQRVVIRD
ncbi:mCG1036725 [Mus musculus]|jgi:hypothetical protein|uniref:Uncharacterized protein n=1 Tax=Mus musculus TaxID=10090 RepID=Q9D9I7_MOUSE|nr:mCG1036725 [Mus musculus]BAB24773.1 unnamed protein product [Mus musculus]